MRKLGVSRRELSRRSSAALLGPARRRLRVRRKRPRPRQSRLPHRGLRLPVFGPARSDPRRGRGPRHRPHGRIFLPRSARRGPRAADRAPQARPDTRPHVQFPPSLRRWTPERFRHSAAKIGPNTEGLISAVLADRPHPEQGCRPAWALRSFCRLDLRAARSRLRPRRRLGDPTPRASLRCSPEADNAAGKASACVAVRPRQSARTRFSTEGSLPCFPAHARPVHALGLHGLAKGFEDLEHRPRRAASIAPNGLGCCSNTRPCAGEAGRGASGGRRQIGIPGRLNRSR